MNTTNIDSAISLHERVAALSDSLPQAESAVAQYLCDHPEDAASATALDLAAAIGTSNATVVRTVRSLGYTGLRELRRSLSRALAMGRDPSQILGQRLDKVGGGSIAHQMLGAGAKLLMQQARTLDGEAWDRAIRLLDAADTVYSYGVHQAGVIAAEFALSHMQNGRRAVHIVNDGVGLATALLAIRNTDAILLIAPLRHFREVEVIISRATVIGTPVILVSEALGHALAERVDVVLRTPQSTLGLARELVVPLVIVEALCLNLAALHRDDAINAHKVQNTLREAIVGAPVDVDAGVGKLGQVMHPHARRQDNLDLSGQAASVDLQCAASR